MKLIVLFVIFCAKTPHLYGDTMEMDDSIVIHAARRSPRQILGLPQRETTVWGNVLREGSACLTSRGHLGFCTSVKHCYPYFKLPNLGLWESWVLGNYDTCTYFDSKGSPMTVCSQAFGVCCTNPITLPPSTTPSEEEAEKPETSEKPNEEEMVTEAQKPEVQKPDANKSPSVWPPPIPTHPPDHTPATHPPWVTGIGHPIAGIPIAVPVAPGTTKPTTKRPGIATTWPTRPPVFQWPPTTTPAPILPTRPSTTTTSPQIPPQVPPSGINANCGVKNGYQDSERIVGGHNADPNEWPWIAVLFNGGRQFCG
uniref:Uncharacterized protein n=1 Tax=Phlebotomus papatasi TaxID=29031 RepID=A0A1B0DND6_PHLPP